jgi:hypothetical protein
MKQLILFLTILLCIGCNAQLSPSKFNLNFEQNIQNKTLPDNWFQWGNYEIRKDTVNAYSGKYSALIVSDEKGDKFGSIAYKILANYKGKQISLQGYMKTENVEDGFAGLLLRIDGNGTSLAFDNMQNQNVNGTNDWKKYTITLPLSGGAENIFVGGILSRKGKAWFDDFTLTIDGENIQTLKEVEKPLSKVQLDKEFDNGSNFQLKEVGKEQIENLRKLCKIWGFLKYHHPAIAKGEVNWDYELFRILHKLNSSDFDSEVLNWIKSVGSVNSEDVNNPNFTTSKIQPDTKWISDNTFISKELCQELTKIDRSGREKQNFYISFFPGVNNPNFQTENPYTTMKWDDTGYQLLALFRYWNMIEYFFPYKNLIEKDWDDVLLNYIPEMVSCNTELSYKLTVLGLIGEIHDTHANIWQQDKTLNQFFGNNTAPLEIRFIENKAVVFKTFKQLNSNSQIKSGDIVTQINGIETDKIVSEKIKSCPASNYPTKLRDVSKRILRTNDETISLTLENQAGSFSETIHTVPVTDINFYKNDVPSHSETIKDIGYIYPATLKKGEIDEIMKSYLDKKGIIIDLRCYPSDFIVFSLGKYLMPEPTEFVKFTTTSASNPGLFTFGETLKVGEKNRQYFKGKVILLVDERTQSNAEYTTMALRVAPKATVIGSTTAGADGNVSTIVIPGNIRTMISGIGVYYPDGRETQRVGIVPDLEIKPTVEGIRVGKDEVLEKAIELINK